MGWLWLDEGKRWGEGLSRLLQVHNNKQHIIRLQQPLTQVGIPPPNDLVILHDLDAGLHTQKSIISSKHPLHVPALTIITYLEKCISSPSAIIRYLPRVVMCLPLADQSTQTFHIMTSIAISSGRQKSTFTILVVVNFLSWVFHAVVVDSLLLSIDVIFPIPVIELIPMFNTMHNFLNFAFPLQVFIQPCSIGDK